MWVFIIAGQSSQFLAQSIPNLNSLFDLEWLSAVDTSNSKNVAALRNTLLLAKVFSKDRVREARICFEGFDHFE